MTTLKTVTWALFEVTLHPGFFHEASAYDSNPYCCPSLRAYMARRAFTAQYRAGSQT